MGRVTLLTDFGTRDGYVAAMKGVLATLAPAVRLDDVAHDLAQGDIRHARWVLGRYWRRFPEGTVHLVVVDPGVGTGRRALALEADDRFVVAPDNGVVSRILDQAGEWRMVELDPDRFAGEELSTTFHGRDLFAPAAAHLARGAPLEELGPEMADPVRLADPEPTRVDDEIRGQVVSEDHFGNLVTNVPGDRIHEDLRVEIQGRALAIRSTYGEVDEGELLALVNSDDRLEVAVRNGSAAKELGAGPGTPVTVLRLEA